MDGKLVHKELENLEDIKNLISKNKHWSTFVDKMLNAIIFIIQNYQCLLLNMAKSKFTVTILNDDI